MKKFLICLHKVLQSAGGIIVALLISPFVVFTVFADLLFTFMTNPWSRHE